MIMTHGDDKGLVLPPKVAPIQIVIIPIYYSKEDEQKIVSKAQEIADILQNKKLRIHVDKRSELTPGYKFNDWELKGVPLRIEIGPKDLEKQKVVMVKRNNRQKTDVPIDKISVEADTQLDQIQKEMFDAAKKLLESLTIQVSDYNEFKSKIEQGGFLEAFWCGKQKCEEKIASNGLRFEN